MEGGLADGAGPVPAVLLTHGGRVVCYDEAAGRLVQLPLHEAAGAASCVIDGAQATLREPGGAAILRARIVGEAGGPVGLQLADGRFLCCAPEQSRLSFDGRALDDWERLMPVPLDGFERLRRVAAARWLLGDDPRPTGPNALRLDRAFRIRFAGRLMRLDAVLDALADAWPGDDPRRLPLFLVLFHDVCEPVPVRLFRPLVYTAIGGALHFYEQLEIAVSSLARFGAYDGELLVVSDRPAAGLSDHLAAFPSERVHLVRKRYRDLCELVETRRTIVATRLFRDFQPILYVDCDVVFDRPIEALLVALARSERLAIAAEYDGRSLFEVGEESANWFGDFLYARQDPRRRQHVCLNCGIFGASSQNRMLAPFDHIARAWDHYRDAHGEHHAAAFDQPFFSFVLQALDQADPALLVDWVHILNTRLPAAGATGLGLVHFNAGVGRDKVAAMRSFYAFLVAGAGAGAEMAAAVPQAAVQRQAGERVA